MKTRAALGLASGLWLAGAAVSAAPPVLPIAPYSSVIRTERGVDMDVESSGTSGDDSTAGGKADAPATASEDARLRWQNGETLPGALAGASAEALSWRTPLFEEPVEIDWSALRRYDRRAEAGKLTDPFAFTLRDGSHLYGALVAVTPETVTIESARHGAVQLRRTVLLSANRVNRAGLPSGGSTGTLGWMPLAERSPGGTPRRRAFGAQAHPLAPPLVCGPGGSLDLPYWNTGAFRATALPEQMDLEFRVRASDRPDFTLSLEPEPGTKLGIETWDGDVVLASGDRFVRLGVLGAADRVADYRICWDRATGHCLVSTPAGVTVADWQLPGAAAEATGTTKTGEPSDGKKKRKARQPKAHGDEFQAGIVLENKGRDLALESLRIGAWDGAAPAASDSTRPGVRLADGRSVPGEITSGLAGSVHLEPGGSAAPLDFPLDAVDAIVFSTGVPTLPDDHPVTTLTWADGTFLVGSIEQLQHGIAAVRTAFGGAPLPARVEGLTQVLLPRNTQASQEKPSDQQDKITARNLTLHGTLQMLGDDQPHWLPAGALKPVVPARTMPYRIDRAAPTAPGAAASALIYTADGDILPGALHAVDHSNVEFDSPYVEATQLGSDDLHAVQFNAPAPARIDGFSDPGWQVVQGDPGKVEHHAGGGVTLAANTALGHAAALACSEVRFRWDNTANCCMRLHLFCPETDATKSHNLALMRNGGMLYYSLESLDGHLENQRGVNVPRGDLDLRLVITDQQVDFFAGGEHVDSFALRFAQREGTGLVIESTALWGGIQRPLELSGFAAESQPGHVSMPAVNAEARRQALTIPRFRQDDPPREALIALNGDVLRGEIMGATASAFVFRSGLESVQVPRDRVRAAVWLQRPSREAAAAPPPAALPARLEKRCPLNGVYMNMRVREYAGIILQWDGDLHATFPADSGNERLRLQFDQPTIGAALAQLCDAAHLTYRLDGNTVIFSTIGTPPATMSERTYWLPRDAFGTSDRAQEVLAARGTTFPEGSTVQWDPGSRQLVVTTTPDCQRALATLLQKDFGCLGTPTHWLLLTDGTRLGLTVDAFEPERVVGHHPLYGRCTVPLAGVASIRTTAPEEGPVGKMFAAWKLLYAPEPVLPRAGDEGDALAGTDPKDFKLPLLGGGDFELGKEKGKVVVLDFWATWCPPCIQSLPGMIEALDPLLGDRVRFVGVDQGEPAAQVRQFLDARGWKLTVALDLSQEVGTKFGAESIPRTVVLRPDGKVARTWTGYHEGEQTEIADTVKQLLADPLSLPKKTEAAPAGARPAPNPAPPSARSGPLDMPRSAIRAGGR